MIRQVAALCVDPKGVYSTMPAVDLWDEARDFAALLLSMARNAHA